ncbi:MAG: 1-acyl-sn-glycerol-3-phosphate acyltransferase [bacterium]|nr:1-acyl-sn-glycerol-3-phosphate acyltransferase [bacterium]
MKILYYLGWLVTRIISKLVFRMRVSGREHFPKSGGFILATNHISYYDPPLVGSWATRQVYFFAKQELFKNKLFGWVIRQTNALPVKRGAIDRQALEMSLEVIAKGYGLTIFPEGTRSKIEGFLDPKPGVGMLAIKAGCPIVPGYLHGSNKLKDCFWGRNRLSIRFGEPFSAEWIKSKEGEEDGYQQIAAAVMARIGELKAATLAANSRQ